MIGDAQRASERQMVKQRHPSTSKSCVLYQSYDMTKVAVSIITLSISAHHLLSPNVAYHVTTISPVILPISVLIDMLQHPTPKHLLGILNVTSI
jgi:hypothetical protein